MLYTEESKSNIRRAGKLRGRSIHNTGWAPVYLKRVFIYLHITANQQDFPETEIHSARDPRTFGFPNSSLLLIDIPAVYAFLSSALHSVPLLFSLSLFKRWAWKTALLQKLWSGFGRGQAFSLLLVLPCDAHSQMYWRTSWLSPASSTFQAALPALQGSVP